MQPAHLLQLAAKPRKSCVLSCSTPSKRLRAHTGMSTGAKVAIVAGIAGGGAGAALAPAGGKKSSTSP